MEYSKITCILSPDNEIAREILMQELGDAGFESFVETEDGIEAYIPSVNFSPEILATQNLQKNEFFSFDHTLEVIADQNWNEVWEQNYFEPLLIEGQCMIMSGFYTTDLEAIEERANSLGLKMTGSAERSNWCSAGFRP